ncbi:metalloprotease [Umbelopsis sp. WA50703]
MACFLPITTAIAPERKADTYKTLYRTRHQRFRYYSMPSAAAFPMSSSENDWKLSENGQHSTFTKPLLKSDNDDRDYRLIRLSNKLEVLLIHDKDTDKSSAALDVHVGHLSDPNDLQGLAHFCEHLLFMGTEKYPKENDYNQYLAEHSGHSNAFTGMENTNYYFERLGLDIRDELLKFHDKYYSANIMKLCIVGRGKVAAVVNPFDQMTTWIVEKFKDVRNKDIDAPASEGHALTPNELTGKGLKK